MRKKIQRELKKEGEKKNTMKKKEMYRRKENA